MAKVHPNEPVNRGTLDEAVSAILEGMNNMVEGLKSEMNTRFDSLEANMNQTKAELKDEIDGLKADLSNTPSRKEFEEVKARVDKHHPLS